MNIHIAHFKSRHFLHTIAHVAYCVFGNGGKACAVYDSNKQVYIDLVAFYAGDFHAAALIVAPDKLPKLIAGSFGVHADYSVILAGSIACYDFFEDLCTVQELKTISQRIVVAKMLSEKCVYTDIVNATGASTATISRVNRSLQYGCDGYDKIFEKIKLEDESKAEENDEL